MQHLKAETRTSGAIPLRERVNRYESGPWRVLTLDTAVRSVVSIQGSFCTFPDFEAGHLVLQDLLVSLLDKGTRRRDRFQIAEELENRGAQLSFSSDGFRVRFSARALPEDVGTVLEIASEQLREPLLDATEFEKARAYVAASLRREMESTGAQATAALSRLLYAPGHPNYVLAPERALDLLTTYSVEDVHRYHEHHFSAARGVIAIVGDIDALVPDSMVDQTFSTWKPNDQTIEIPSGVGGYRADHSTVVLADKSNSDVRLGHPVEVLRSDEDYIPLYVGNYVLGGNFSARLMNIIRDRMGLTYGIWSHLSGITTDYSGHWAIGLTLSRATVDEGTAATRAEIERFVRDGINATELDEKKTTIAGAFQVGLATTGGLASILLYNAERGFDVEYLDRFSDEVRSLEADQVNAAIRRHLDPGKLSHSIAGESTPAER